MTLARRTELSFSQLFRAGRHTKIPRLNAGYVGLREASVTPPMKLPKA